MVAVSLLPEPNYVDVREQHQLDAVILLEQLEPGKLARHSLERISCDHATADVADIDGDGRADFVTGSFSLIGVEKNVGEKSPPSRIKDWVTVWRNASGKR
jgi:hypothetical protein